MMNIAYKSSWQKVIRDYLQLTKPRIVLLLLFTTITAMVVAADGKPFPLVLLLMTVIGGGLSAGGASALNQYFDRTMDASMSRTKNRPLPSKRIQPINALIFGCALLAWSILILGIGVNWLTAFLSIVGAVYYLAVYTLWLKRNTPMNIVIGGGAGAIPVLVGWAAITGSIAPHALLLFSIIFFWTPPHSWALALLVNKDYQRASVPMLPAVHGTKIARLQIVWYSLLLVLLTLLPYPLGMLGWPYFVVAGILGAILLHHALKLLKQHNQTTARQMFKFSSYYLALLFLMMIADCLIANLIF